MIPDRFRLACPALILALAGFRCVAVNEIQKSFGSGDYSKTLALARQAVAADSSDAGAWMWMARAHEKSGNPDSASAALGRALAVRTPDAAFTREAFRLYLAIGDRFRKIGEERTARLRYEKADSLRPLSVDVLVRLAGLDESQGRLKEAVSRYETLIELAPDPTPYIPKVNLLESRIRSADESFGEGMDAFRAENYERAVSHFSRSIEAWPAQPGAAYYFHLSEGIRDYRIATPDARRAGREALRKAAEADTRAAEPHFWIARLWEMENKHALLGNAIDAYETALRLEPDGPLAGRSAEKIGELKRRKERMDDFWNRGRP